MNITAEELALMYLQCRVNRRKQLVSAMRAANTLIYHGVLAPPPSGISKSRWAAMVNSLIVRGEV